jgi:DNA modification methylase
MAMNQIIEENYALYNGGCIEIMREMPDCKIDMSIYSPPFATGTGGLYVYSSDPKDLSNCITYEQYFTHYEFVVREIYRLTKPGRITAVHCMDVPRGGANAGLTDFPGDIIRLHEKVGFRYCARYHIWKEPLGVRNRTMAKGLAHKQIVEDSSLCDNAAADYLLMFRRKGENAAPIAHPVGLTRYAGERTVPHELLKYKGWTGNQIENRYSHWIWRQYASAFWDDIRIDEVLEFEPARDKDDEKHVHPSQLDVIERACVLWTNPGEIVFTPFAGVGSEVYGAIVNGRKGIGVELKPSYFRQAVKNCAMAKHRYDNDELQLKT